MRKYIAGCLFISILLLTGCNFGASAESQLSKVFSDMNQHEKKFRIAQSDLHDVEKIEQALFNKTIKLSQEQADELESKIFELEGFIEQRVALLSKEEASIRKAKKVVPAFGGIIKKAEDNKQGQLKELELAVKKRYELHAEFVVAYKELIILQKGLYDMLSDEKTVLANLQKEVEKVNAQNKTVKSIINSFNESTITINGLKDKAIGNTIKE